jgi:protein-tyrosine-phosphatase
MASDMNSKEKTSNILFVCSGNTCRSPMAEVLARQAAADLGLDSLEIRSAGTHAAWGTPASGGARRTVRLHQLSLEGHSSTHLSPELLAWADLVLTMGPGHLLQVQMLGAGEKAALLGAFAHGHDPGEEVDGEVEFAVPDPFGASDELYEVTYQKLERYVLAAMKRVAEGLQG